MTAQTDDLEEQAFLSNYDENAYPRPLYSVDGALFTFHEGILKLLLVQRSNHPHRGQWALPGGYVDLQVDTDIDATMLRKLIEKTRVAPGYIEQLGTYGGRCRDPRGWSVTTCYTALIAHQHCEAGINAVVDAKWWPLDELRILELAFDHAQLIDDARERLKQKALYSIVPAYALPEPFTLPELQQLHEALIGKPLQKKSFRRRIEQADLLIDTGDKRSEGGRPASLYRMKAESAGFNFVRNLEG